LGIFDPTNPAKARSLKRALVVALGIAAFSLPTFAFASDSSTTATAATKVTKRQSDSDNPFSTENRKSKPFFLMAGYYYADTSIVTTDGGGNFSTTTPSPGGELALGYRVPFDNGELRAVIRASGFTYDDGFGGTGSIYNTSYEFDVLFRAQGFYAGVGIDYISGTDDSNIYIPAGTGSSQALFSQTIGYDFSPTSFVEFHYHNSTTYPGYSGGSLTYGIRF